MLLLPHQTPVVLRQQSIERDFPQPNTDAPRSLKKKLVGAEEKIQEELREMKRREEELK